jgi:hypothetical protein
LAVLEHPASRINKSAIPAAAGMLFISPSLERFFILESLSQIQDGPEAIKTPSQQLAPTLANTRVTPD